MLIERLLMGGLIFLLLVLLIYAIILERRFAGAQNAGRNFTLLLKQFYESSRKLRQEMQDLQQQARFAQTALQEERAKAELVRDEMRFLEDKHLAQRTFTPSVEQTPPLSHEEQDLITAMKMLK